MLLAAASHHGAGSPRLRPSPDPALYPSPTAPVLPDSPQIPFAAVGEASPMMQRLWGGGFSLFHSLLTRFASLMSPSPSLSLSLFPSPSLSLPLSLSLSCHPRGMCVPLQVVLVMIKELLLLFLLLPPSALKKGESDAYFL